MENPWNRDICNYFLVIGGLVVIVRRKCTTFGEFKSMICGCEGVLRGYFDLKDGLSDF